MVKSELDYEILAEHQCTITVSDGFLSASGISTISVVDINDIQVESITILDSLGHNVVSEGLSTIGNNIVRIRGSNLAYLNKSNKIDITVTNAHVASPSTTFEASLLNCKINENYGRGNEEVSCDSPPGHGNMLSMEIEVTRPDTQDDTWGLSLDHIRTGLRYAIPQIFSVYSLNGTTLKTEGGEDFMLIGENFGPMLVTIVIVEYGPNGVGICAKNCKVLEAHTRARCTSSPGVGKNHRLTISVGFDRHSLISTASISYTPPQMHALEVPTLKLDTRGTSGGNAMVIFGNNFGPATRTFTGCFGLTMLSLPGVTGTYSNEILQYGLSCSVKVDNSVLECHVSPGVGRNFRVTINSGGQSSLTHRSNLSNISYFTPLLKSVTGAGTREASTAGGQIVNVEGDYLGPIVSTASLVIVEYGKYPDS